MDLCPGPDAWFALGEDPELVRHLDRCIECRRVAAMIGRLGVFGDVIGSSDHAGVIPELVPAGTTLGRFVVRGAIGAGGMGVVLEAFDPTLERTIALKVVRKLRDDASWKATRERVLGEAKAMARVSHPNVVAIHDVFEIGDERLIAMEHVAGPDLETWLVEKPAFAARMTIVLGVAEGLAAAHAAGIVHRDVKPTNILVANGQARVTDFGLAGLADADMPRALGTKGYVAPEVIAGGVADARSDQYAFAVTAWRTLFDEWPSQRGGRTAKVLRRAMSEDPAARYASMREVVLALRRRRVWWIAAPIAIVVIVVAIVLLRRDDAASCSLDATIDPAWSNEARAAWQAAMTKQHGANAAPLAPALDAAWTSWIAHVNTACEKPTPVTIACLASQRRKLVALIRHAPDNKKVSSIEDAIAVIRSTDCVSAPPPQPSNLSPETQKLHDQLAAEADEAMTVLSLGQYKKALAQLDALLARVPASDPELRAVVMYRRADALARTGKPAEAIPQLREALGIAERAGNPIVRVNVMIELLSAYDGLGRADEANALAPVAEAAAQAVPYDAVRATRLANVLGGIAQSSGRFADAERHYREVVAIQEKRAGDKPSAKVAGGLYNLALAVHAQGRGDEARTLQERALAIFEVTTGPSHPDTALAIGALAGYAYEAKRYDESITLFRRQIAIWETALGKDHPNLAEPLSGLARAVSVGGDHDEAVALYRRAITVAKALGDHHPLVAQTQYRLAGALGGQGQPKEAAALAEQSVAAWDSNGFDIPDAHLARFMLAEYRWDAGQRAAARKLAESARAGLAKADKRYAADVEEIDAWLRSHR